MIKPGRKSVAERSSARLIAGGLGRRAEPFDFLTKRQAEIWREVVESEHPDFFKTAALRFMLADYCRHSATAAGISRKIEDMEPECLGNEDEASAFHDLLRMRELETRAAAGLATKLRLTNQSRYTTQRAATDTRNTTTNKPWARAS